MLVKIHKNQNNQIVLAVCDSNLLGKQFEEGNRQIDLTSDFYKGEEKTDKEVVDLMRNAYLINIVGENATKLALKEGLINCENILKISKIPYANVMAF